MKVFGILKGFSIKLTRKSNFCIRCIFLKLAIFGILILCSTVAVFAAEGLVRLHLGTDLQFVPGRRTSKGFGELHLGYESEVSYKALYIGVASKSFLSSTQLKNADVVGMLDKLAQSDDELYIGLVIDWVFFSRETPPDVDYILPGGAKVNPGLGLSVRFEPILNFSNSKSEKDPYKYWDGGTYLSFYIYMKPFLIRLMPGIGVNERLDYHFIKRDLLEVERDTILRWKYRLDVSTPEFIKIDKSSFRLFLSIQHEQPMEKTATLQLEDGTFTQASPPRAWSVRIGILIDVFSPSNGQ